MEKNLGLFEVDCKEMMFYQYLPIKLSNQLIEPIYEKRLEPFSELINECCSNFLREFGIESYKNSYIYLSAKHLFQVKGNPFNRPGWHIDGFMTDDINYIWSNKFPTIFNRIENNFTKDDVISMQEMEEQCKEENNYFYPNNSLIRLDSNVVHKVGEVTESGMRTFFKLSFSRDKYDLEGNTHNYLLDYNWEMNPRKLERNIPQKL